jgi:hypothetical protein
LARGRGPCFRSTALTPQNADDETTREFIMIEVFFSADLAVRSRSVSPARDRLPRPTKALPGPPPGKEQQLEVENDRRRQAACSLVGFWVVLFANNLIDSVFWCFIDLAR